MQLIDTIRLSNKTVRAQPMRSGLTALGIAIGIASVVLLTSLAHGVQIYALTQFTQFGTSLIGVTPGKTTTAGVSGALISNVRPLTIEDGEALSRLRSVRGMVPVIQGNARIEAGRKSRRSYVLGVNHQAPEVFNMHPSLGRFLPDDPPGAARALTVLGGTVKEELFGRSNPLGERVRIGGERYQVIGVMESKGQMLGFDMDDAVYIPAGRALAMFNRDSLMEIDLLFDPMIPSESVAEDVRRLLIKRHGAEDFTIVTQEQMLEVLGSVLNILTLSVGALGAISLFVGGVGILTIMTISVHERTSEVGLMRAIGATRRQILGVFLTEAVMLSSLGGLAGLAVGIGGAWLLGVFLPALPNHVSPYYVFLSEALAAFIGLAAGVLPAFRAANMDPIESLRAE